MRPTDDVPVDPLAEIEGEVAPDPERPVSPAGAAGDGADPVPDDERAVGPLDDSHEEA